MSNRELLFECVVLLRSVPGASIPVRRRTAGRKSPDEASRWAPAVWVPVGDLECGVSLSSCPLMVRGTFGHLLGSQHRRVLWSVLAAGLEDKRSFIRLVWHGPLCVCFVPFGIANLLGQDLFGCSVWPPPYYGLVRVVFHTWAKSKGESVTSKYRVRAGGRQELSQLSSPAGDPSSCAGPHGFTGGGLLSPGEKY